MPHLLSVPLTAIWPICSAKKRKRERKSKTRKGAGVGGEKAGLGEGGVGRKEEIREGGREEREEGERKEERKRRERHHRGGRARHNEEAGVMMQPLPSAPWPESRMEQ